MNHQTIQPVLWKHQRTALAYTGRVDNPALFMQMRLGKTRVVLTRFRIDHGCYPFRALIVAPYSALDGWAREAVACGYSPESVVWVTGAGDASIEALRRPGRIYLLNREGHRRVPQVTQFPWDEVVLDESTFIKSPKAAVTEFYVKGFRSVGRRWVLTGTPTPENELDIVEQLRFLDTRILGVESFWQFRHLFGQPCDYNPHDYRLTAEGMVFLQERLGKYCLSMTRRDAGVEVRKVYERRFVKMPDDLRTRYEQARDEFEVVLPGLLAGGRALTLRGLYAVQSYQWMRRLCSGIWPVAGEVKQLWDGKFAALYDLLNGELRNEQVVVWCHYVDEVEHIAKTLALANTRGVIGYVHGGVPAHVRDSLAESFRKGVHRILVCNPACFRHGVDLGSADTMVYFSTPESLEERMQSEDRVIRLGKTSVLCVDLQTEDTIEEDIYDSLLRKERVADMVRRMMRGGGR